MILRWPAGLPAGQHSTAFAHFSDWLPTLLAAAGADPARHHPPGLDGRDLLPVLRSLCPDTPPPRCWQFSRFHPDPRQNAAIRDGHWKLVRPGVPQAFQFLTEDVALSDARELHPERFPAGPPPPLGTFAPAVPLRPQLFDLSTDPEERLDLAAAQPALTARLLAELDTWFDSVEQDRRTAVQPASA